MKCTIKKFQIRIDFEDFVIAGPSTDTRAVATEIGGSIVPAWANGAVAVCLASNCLTDTFSLTGPGGSVPPVICGKNTGQHGN